MKVKKTEPLKARGIRFSDAAWSNIEADAKRDKSGRTKASDIVRQIVDEYYEQKKKPR